MRSFTLGLAAVAFFSATAVFADSNAGGVLILHYNAAVNASCDLAGYFCGQSNIDECEDAITRQDSTEARECATCFVLAAFSSESQPRLLGASFGLDYDPAALAIEHYGRCATSETSTETWPSPGSGTKVRFAEVRRTRMVELYELVVVRLSSAPTTLRLTRHPTEGAWFEDDSGSARRDSIAAFGSMGFDLPGERPCPLPQPPSGACCLLDGSCEIRIAAQCAGNSLRYRGDGSFCDPNPCRPLGGACCALDGTCRQSLEYECNPATGATWQRGVACDPNPCPPVLGPVGGCCFLSGVCVMASPDECARREGTYLGDDTPCESEPCLARGACCVGASCVVMPPAMCADASGTYFGTEALCLPHRCDVESGGCGGSAATGQQNGEATHVGVSRDTGLILTEGGCTFDLHLNADYSYEDAYAWQLGGVALPSYGAFAEKIADATGAVCGVTLDLTQVDQVPGYIDVYVWADEQGCPGRALCVTPNLRLSPSAAWPELDRKYIDVGGCCVEGDFWVGFAGLWSDQPAAFYVGADLDGPGGHPFTNIRPGIGYPSGWHDVSLVWPGTKALGIGCLMTTCPEVAVEKLSWGRVKALYQGSEGGSSRSSPTGRR